MFSPSDMRAVNRGFGEAMSRAFEFAATPLLFGAAGYGIDHLAGTPLVFTFALAAFAVVGSFLRVWVGYDAEMRRHEANAIWNPNRVRPASSDEHAGDVDLWAMRKTGSGA